MIHSSLNKLKTIPLAFAGLALLTACGGGTVPDGGTSASVGEGEVITMTLSSGLQCDVFDTYKGGTVDCDFDSFTPPASWKPGVVDSEDVADGTLRVLYFEDRHYCAVFDGYESGGMACLYPKR